MTANEMIKALEWCEQFEHNIVFKGNGDERCVQALQVMVVIKHALKEYNSQKAEIKQKDTEIAILIRKNETLKDEVAELRADKEALINGQITLQEKLPGVIKNEAYKEFADRLKNCFCISKEYLDVMMIIDNLLAEMEERE